MSEQIPVKQVDPKLHAEGKPQTVELYASRKKIYVKEVTGIFQRIRTVSLCMLMGAYFAICWINVNGAQWVHFDLPARKFHLFGTTFWPQDFILLSWLLIICAFGLFFITSLFGRVWCGYTCPQTVWTFIFMWIEERIEGSRNQRIKLDKSPSSGAKFAKKAAKHIAWFLVAFATGLTFVGYFYPIRELVVDIFTFSISDHWAYFWIMFFTVATYLNAGWMREQVCLYMCPYARFQSVMFDPDTRVVSYDFNRGEARGGRKHGIDYKAQGLGDCIDCGQCVHVCPTGIDIRDGLQYECIGCALCIDVCDQVMEKMDYPKGLIRYTTENILDGRPSKLLRPRTFGYAAVLMIMVGAVAYTIATRIPLAIDVIRDRGALFRDTGLGNIENSYTLKIMNMSNDARTYRVGVSGMDGISMPDIKDYLIDSGEVFSLPISVEVPANTITTAKSEIEFVVEAVDGPAMKATASSSFLGPVY